MSKTISELFPKLAEEICDYYCKFTAEENADNYDDQELEEICADCPLGRKCDEGDEG